MRKKLSIIIPVFNEEKTISQVLEKVLEFNLQDKEVIVVNDGSTDSTKKILDDSFSNKKDLIIISKDKNRGKGFAVREGINASTGDIILIQDADTEYDPNDFKILLDPINKGYAEVVYGSRFIGSNPHRVMYFANRIANSFLTFFSNLLTNLNLTDMETGYKVFNKELLNNFELKENDFGFEPELTMKLAKTKCRFYEVGISYKGRTYEEGKKIRAIDFFKALIVLIRYKFFR